MLNDRFVEMNKPFDDEIRLRYAVGALRSTRVHESVVGTNIVGADKPVVWVSGNFSKEEKDSETVIEFIFLELDTSSPIEKA